MVRRAEFSDACASVVICVASSRRDRDPWSKEIGNVGLGLGGQVVTCKLADGGMAKDAPC